MKNYEEKKQAIIDIINNMSDDEMVCIWNNYLDETNYSDNRIYSVDEIDEILCDTKPWEILRMGFYGDYRPCDAFFKFDGYGNLKSFDYPSDEIYADEIAEYCIDKDEDFDSDEIREILDEEDEEEKDDDE